MQTIVLNPNEEYHLKFQKPAPPDVPWENFCYYRNRVRQLVEEYQPESLPGS